MCAARFFLPPHGRKRWISRFMSGVDEEHDLGKPVFLFYQNILKAFPSLSSLLRLAFFAEEEPLWPDFSKASEARIVVQFSCGRKTTWI